MHHQGHRWGLGGHGAPVTPPTPPTLTLLSPDASGQWNAEVVLTGTGFRPDSRIMAGQGAQPTTYDSPTQLRSVSVADKPAGVYDVWVRNGSTDSNKLQFTRF